MIRPGRKALALPALACLVFAAVLLAARPAAAAGFVITMSQTQGPEGPMTMLTGSGSFDLTGLAMSSTYGPVTFIGCLNSWELELGQVWAGYLSVHMELYDVRNYVSFPPGWRPWTILFFNWPYQYYVSVEEDPLFILWQGYLFLPWGYVSGAPFTDYSGMTRVPLALYLTWLHVAPGNYTWKYGPYSDQTITIVVPEQVVANAGPDQTLTGLGCPVSLDGSGSSGQGLTYAWTVQSAPAGSTAGFSNPDIVNPTFTPDVWGNYVLKLTVTGSDNASSSDTMTISVDSLPVAAASASPLALVWHDTTVTLDGGQSYDADGDALTYSWTLTAPAGSTAALSDPAAVDTTFVADVFGDYSATLTITDPAGNSSTATVKMSFNNLPPVANAGYSQAVTMNTTVTLDGSASYDPNKDPITYQWSFASKPTDSQAKLSGADTPSPTFIADWPGAYVVELVVNDGQLNSTPANVEIQVSATRDGAVGLLQDLSASVRKIPLEAFKNHNMKNALLNKINSAISSIDAGDYQDALDQLQDDILQKTNGCSDSSPQAPDKNDWITNCGAQQKIYKQIQDIIEIVQDLM